MLVYVLNHIITDYCDCDAEDMLNCTVAVLTSLNAAQNFAQEAEDQFHSDGDPKSEKISIDWEVTINEGNPLGWSSGEVGSGFWKIEVFTVQS